MSQPSTAIVPPARPDTDDAALDRLLHPSRFYDHPDEVLRDDLLSAPEKRAILSSWASDACAVESCPSLRRAAFAARPVSFDDVMEALSSLDRASNRPSRGSGRATGGASPGSPHCT